MEALAKRTSSVCLFRRYNQNHGLPWQSVKMRFHSTTWAQELELKSSIPTQMWPNIICLSLWLPASHSLILFENLIKGVVIAIISVAWSLWALVSYSLYFFFLQSEQGVDELFRTPMQLLYQFLRTSPLSGGRGMSTTHIITVIESKRQRANGIGAKSHRKCLAIEKRMPKGLKPVWLTNSNVHKAQEKQSSPPQPLTQSKRNTAFQNCFNDDRSLWHLRIRGW